ncbi:YbaB/EbfC family nucleoid-associated protein [Mycobacterium deserti]|nr:YbaB/EbfC family nucleoid-associated protein [Mycobacterium deserti]
MTEVLALVQEQMADIAAVQRKQAELTASAAVADGMVEVTVSAHGHVIATEIDESYLDEYELQELGDHITAAAQQAARTVADRAAEMMAPIADRRRFLPGLSEIVEGAPDLRDLAPQALDPFAKSETNPHDEDDTAESAFPTVRR